MYENMFSIENSWSYFSTQRGFIFLKVLLALLNSFKILTNLILLTKNSNFNKKK